MTSAPVIVVRLSLILDLRVVAGDVLTHGGGQHGVLGVIPQSRERHHDFHNNRLMLYNFSGSFVATQLSFLLL